MHGSDTIASRTREFIRRIVIPIDDQFDGDIGAADGDTVRLKLPARRRALVTLC